MELKVENEYNWELNPRFGAKSLILGFLQVFKTAGVIRMVGWVSTLGSAESPSVPASRSCRDD